MIKEKEENKRIIRDTCANPENLKAGSFHVRKFNSRTICVDLELTENLKEAEFHLSFSLFRFLPYIECCCMLCATWKIFYWTLKGQT